jgi:hypothetical protein
VAGSLLAFAAAVLPLRAGDEGAVAGSWFGDPLPLRGQMPSLLPFLELTPATAFLLPRGAWRFNAGLAYENTHAVSDDMVRTYSDGARHLLTLSDLEVIAAGSKGGTAYLVDGETLRLMLSGSVGLGARLEAGFELPLLFHTGGFLDGTIESYHDHLGFGDGGRSAFEQDRYIVGYADPDGTFYLEGAPGGLRPGDLGLTLRGSIFESPSGGSAVAATLGLEVPTGDVDRLEGNGAFDAAFGIEASWRFSRSSLHAGGRYTVPGGWDAAPWVDLGARAGGFAAWERRFGADWGMLAQVVFGRGPMPHRVDADLGDETIEMALGFRILAGDLGEIDLALLENLLPSKNAPDVGAYVGWRSRPGRRGPPAAGP